MQARFSLSRQDLSVCIYILAPLGAQASIWAYIYMYMGHIHPIQALHTYIWIPYHIYVFCLHLDVNIHYVICIYLFGMLQACRPTSNTKLHTGLENVPKRILILNPGTYMPPKQQRQGTT